MAMKLNASQAPMESHTSKAVHLLEKGKFFDHYFWH
jgi:hypothetical protein